MSILKTDNSAARGLLAIDSSDKYCSVALHWQGEESGYVLPQTQQHAELILAEVDRLLIDNGVSLSQLDAIAVTQGPGSFTGIRVGLSLVKALAYGVDIPVISLSSLRCLAQQAFRRLQSQQVLAVMDARLQEVYCGAYKNHAGVMKSTSPDTVMAISAWQAPEGSWTVLGSGAALIKEIHEKQNQVCTFTEEVHYPEALDLLALAQLDFQQGNLCSAHDLNDLYLQQPTYLKMQDVAPTSAKLGSSS